MLKSIISRQEFQRFGLRFLLFITLLLGSLLLWEHMHGGIPSHHFLAKKDMPLVSNFWGLLTIPLLTWFSFFRLEKRLFSESETITFPKEPMISFCIALLFGLALGLAVQYNFKAFSSNSPFIMFGLALFFPTYRAECFLGFVLGLTYFVGGVLPIVAGSVFLLISAAIYFLIRPLILKIFSLFTNN